jgi:hypothetical protein
MLCGGHAPVAQLDRVSVFETEGWRFEPFRARQYEANRLRRTLFSAGKRRHRREKITHSKFRYTFLLVACGALCCPHASRRPASKTPDGIATT